MMSSSSSSASSLLTSTTPRLSIVVKSEKLLLPCCNPIMFCSLLYQLQQSIKGHIVVNDLSMEAVFCPTTALYLSAWVSKHDYKLAKKSPDSHLQLSMAYCHGDMVSLRCMPRMSNTIPLRGSSLQITQVAKDSQAPLSESGNHSTCFGRSLLLQNKAQEVAPLLNKRCIFLVGMMGSGKTTVGKILADALGYSFVDSDKFIEQAVGFTSVAQIFQQCGESFFREHESEALRKLSLTHQQIIATGGGAVTCSINWKYMNQGVSVWLDAPLDALAKRIAAVGTDSRPLLDFESGDAYTKAFMGLFTLSKRRTHAYANADTTVSLQHIASKLCLGDILDVTPSAIAIEVIEQLGNFLYACNRTPV